MMDNKGWSQDAKLSGSKLYGTRRHNLFFPLVMVVCKGKRKSVNLR